MDSIKVEFLIVAFSVLIIVSAFYFFRVPTSEKTWLVSLLVSVYYGPCLGILLTLSVLSFVLNVNTSLQLFFLLPALLVLLIIIYKKWSFIKGLKLSLSKPLSFAFFWLPLIKPKADQQNQISTRDGSSIPVDFYFHQNKSAPLIFFLFGGGFENNNQKQHPIFLNHIRNLGFHVAAIGYRQLPLYPWPIPLEDIEDSISAIMKSPPPNIISPNAYHIMGRSAGGFLALHASLSQFEKPIATATAIYPVTDLVLWSKEPISNAVLESHRRVDLLVKQDWLLAQNLSLIQKDYPKSTRYFLVSGDWDPVVDVQQTRKLNDWFKASNITSECLILMTESHGFDFNLNSWATQSFFYQWSKFLRS